MRYAADPLRTRALTDPYAITQVSLQAMLKQVG